MWESPITLDIQSYTIGFVDRTVVKHISTEKYKKHIFIPANH